MHLKNFTPIETNRLFIRLFQQEDWQAVHAYTSNAEVMFYLPEGQMTRAQTQAYVEKQLGEQPEAVGVVLKSTQQFMGHISFHEWFAPRIFEIGWVFHPDFYGHGFAPEAAQCVLQFGFEVLDVHRVIATCQPENIGSMRVMEKLKMTREGHFRQCIARENGVWWDEYFYAILADEWFEENQETI